VHDAIEISKFLRVLGSQKIQATLNLEDTAVSFVFNTSRDRVNYIQVTHGRVEDSTVHLEVDLNWLAKPSVANLIKTPAYLFKNNVGPKKFWNTFRLIVAVGTEVVASNLSKQKTK
jgi:hypothetical protein